MEQHSPVYVCTVTIQTHLGLYLGLVGTSDELWQDADASPPSARHYFRLHFWPSGLVSLQSQQSGRWLCAEPGGRAACDRERADAWEQFQVVPVPHASSVGLLGCCGAYLCCVQEVGDPARLGAVVADRTHCKQWEHCVVAAAPSTPDGAAWLLQAITSRPVPWYVSRDLGVLPQILSGGGGGAEAAGQAILERLRAEGVIVIPGVFSQSLCASLERGALSEADSVHAPWAWAVRQLPPLAAVFACYWRAALGRPVTPEDLLVSFDGSAVTREPPEAQGAAAEGAAEGFADGSDWLHVDSRFDVPHDRVVQASVTLRDVRPGDESFLFLSRSHLHHEELGRRFLSEEERAQRYTPLEEDRRGERRRFLAEKGALPRRCSCRRGR